MKECLLHFVDTYTLILKKPANKQQKNPCADILPSAKTLYTGCMRKF